MEGNFTTGFPNVTWRGDLTEGTTIYDLIQKNITFGLQNSTQTKNHSILSNGSEVVTDVYDIGLRLNFYTKVDDYVVATAYTTIAALGIILNILAMVVIGTGRHTSGEVKIQLINLAIADFLSALIIPGLALNHVLLIPFPSSEIFCGAARFIGWGAFYTSPLWNVTISVERFVVVYFPFKATRYTKTHKLVVVGLVWLVGASSQIEGLLYSKINLLENVPVCGVDSPFERDFPVIYEWLMTVKFLLPSAVIVVMYTLIGFKLVFRRRVGESMKSRDGARAFRRRNVQVLRMLVIDAVVTLVTWLPFNFSYPILKLAGKENALNMRENFIMNAVLIGIMITNCFTSPVIYYAFNLAFRKDTVALCRRVKKQTLSVAFLRGISTESSASYMSRSARTSVETLHCPSLNGVSLEPDLTPGRA